MNFLVLCSIFNNKYFSNLLAHLGFDYIRKKKKTTVHSESQITLSNNIIKKRLQARENLETKDESDIAKEIKGWVLNKGVGESVLHKASRLNYMVKLLIFFFI